MSIPTPIIKFISHACISIEVDNDLMLCDPWFDGDVFNNSWSLLVKPNVDNIDFSKLKYIWISHEHPDHLNFLSLNLIKQRAEQTITVYYRKQTNPNVKQAIEKLKFRCIELPADQTVAVNENISITSYPAGEDTSLVIEAGNKTFLNQNDCHLSRKHIDRINQRFPNIDAWFFQFSLAGYYANADDTQGLEQAQEKHLSLIEKYYKVFTPKIFVPFASFVYFCKSANAFLNKYAVSLDEIVRRFPTLPIQVLVEADELLWVDYSARNQKNLQIWRELFASSQSIKTPTKVDEQDILEAGYALVQEAKEKSFFCFVPGPYSWKLTELIASLK